jgi:rubrerythrin
MLPANLTPLEVIDVGIHSETLAYKMYDRLARRVDVATLQARLGALKKDEKEHRKTLRAHRRAVFGPEPAAVSEADAEDIFGTVDVTAVVDRDSLVQALYGAIRFEEYGAYFYDRQRHKIPNQDARIFFEVLASECRCHADIIRQQIAAVRTLNLQLDERGRSLELV